MEIISLAAARDHPNRCIHNGYAIYGLIAHIQTGTYAIFRRIRFDQIA